MANANFSHVTFISNCLDGNSYQKIWFTFIMLHLPSFQESVSYFSPSYHIIPSQPGLNALSLNFGIPNNFNPELEEKCIISLVNINSTASTTTTLVDFIDDGNYSMTDINQVNFVNIISSDYQILCLQTCDIGYIDTYILSFLCLPCQPKI